MKIARAELDDTDIFDRDKLDIGACCFYSEDKAYKYFFEINKRDAILHANEYRYVDEAIDEFLFYSGFITTVKNPKGHVLKTRTADKLERLSINDIQPSQLYINERKLVNCKRWISSEKDIMIPITVIDSKVISLDGHTRLRAALNLGYDFAYVYPDDCGEYIGYFVDEAVKRKILRVSDMEMVRDEEYKLKWHKFCDDYFDNLS